MEFRVKILILQIASAILSGISAVISEEKAPKITYGITSILFGFTAVISVVQLLG